MARTNPAQKKTEQETPQTPEPEAVVEPEVAEEKAEKVAKGPSLYHVYTTDDDGKTLNWIADKEVKTGRPGARRQGAGGHPRPQLQGLQDRGRDQDQGQGHGGVMPIPIGLTGLYPFRSEDLLCV
jgi:hypothetical protein